MAPIMEAISNDENVNIVEENTTHSTKYKPIKAVKVETGLGITQINKLSDTNWVNWWEDIL